MPQIITSRDVLRQRVNDGAHPVESRAAKEFARAAEQLMGSAPTTLRPSAREKAKQMLDESNGGAVLVTNSD